MNSLLLLALLSPSRPAQTPPRSTPVARAAWPEGLGASARPVRLSRKAVRPKTPVLKAPAPKAPAALMPTGPKHQATPAKATPPAADGPSGRGVVLADPYPEDVPPAPGELGSPEWVDTLHILQAGLARPGRALTAVDQAENYFDEHPNQRTGIGYLLADLYVALGRWNDAYRLMAPLATADADQPTLLRCSVAAAAHGDVYPGQRAYCVRSILSVWSGTEDRRENMPQGISAADVLTVSLLATACDADSHGDFEAMSLYGGLVLRRDPGNPLASWMLADDAMRQSRFANAVAFLNRGLARTRGGNTDAFRVRLRENRDLLATQIAAKTKAGAVKQP